MIQNYTIYKWYETIRQAHKHIQFCVKDESGKITNYNHAKAYMPSDVKEVYDNVLKYKAKEKAKIIRDQIENAPVELPFDGRTVLVQVATSKDLIKIMGTPAILDMQDTSDPDNAPHTIEPLGWRMADNTYERLTSADMKMIPFVYSQKSALAFEKYAYDLAAIENNDFSMSNLIGLADELNIILGD